MTTIRERSWKRYSGTVSPGIDYPHVTLYEAGVVSMEPPLKFDAMSWALIDSSREWPIKSSCPREVEFRRQLPKAQLGTIDFEVRVAEHVAKGAR